STATAATPKAPAIAATDKAKSPGQAPAIVVSTIEFDQCPDQRLSKVPLGTRAAEPFIAVAAGGALGACAGCGLTAALWAGLATRLGPIGCAGVRDGVASAVPVVPSLALSCLSAATLGLIAPWLATRVGAGAGFGCALGCAAAWVGAGSSDFSHIQRPSVDSENRLPH